jgi:hypothetical protein
MYQESRGVMQTRRLLAAAANEFELALRYFYLCLDLPHAGSVARMPRRRQALIRRRRLASYEY